MRDRPTPQKKDRSNFITNQNETFKDRLKTIIQGGAINIAYLDLLVGYFRISGFIHLCEIIDSKLEQFEEIRILAGIDADFLDTKILKGINPKTIGSDEYKEEFYKDQVKYLNAEPYSENVEKSFERLEALKNKVQLRIIKGRNVHAKVYILSAKPTQKPDGSYRYDGSIFVGSSNLTRNGWVNNHEFNAELNGTDDIENALYEFENLWQDSIEVTQELIEDIKKATYLREISADDLYYKLLLEYFGADRIKLDTSIENLFPKPYKPFEYQIQAITDGISKLNKYNGFFLSDVVGLGKTLIATLIVRKLKHDGKLKGRILITTPPALKSNWEDAFDKVEINCDIQTHDSLDKIKHADRYDLIIIDESHRFKSNTTDRYNEIQRICRSGAVRKKVILISATPFNNSPKDLANQIYLFCDRFNTKVGHVQNLSSFFNDRQKEYDKLNKAKKENSISDEDYKAQLKNISDKIRNEVMNHIMVRRTRGDIQKLFGADLEKQGMRFPTIEPNELKYELDQEEEELISETLKLLDLQTNRFGQYGYARYLLYPNLTNEGKEIYHNKHGESMNEERGKFYIQTAERLKGLMQCQLFKRFESSISAFISTLDKQISFLEILTTMFEHHHKMVFLQKQRNIEKYFEDLIDSDKDEDEINGLNQLSDCNDESLSKIAKATRYLEIAEQKHEEFLILESKHFKKSYIDELSNDLRALTNLKNAWINRGRIEGETTDIKSMSGTDSKLKRLKSALVEQITRQIKDTKRQDDQPKIILFTEAQTSARYIFESISNSTQGDNKGTLKTEILNQIQQKIPCNLTIGVLQVDASNRKHNDELMRKNFDANLPENEQENTFHILISTDTLSEGVNMHRSDVLINYDAPWNPASLMQRAGRINRVGTRYESIYVYQFKPTSQGDEVLNLNQTLYNKAQMFHHTLGEDSPVYSADEQTGQSGIYNPNNEEEVSEDTEFLADITKLYREDPDKFEVIQKLSPKIRVALSGKNGEAESYFYLKQEVVTTYKNAPTRTELQDHFYYICGDGEVGEKDFIDMARRLKSLKNKCSQQALAGKISKVHFDHAKKVLEKHNFAIRDKNISTPNREIPTNINNACRAIRQSLLDNDEKNILTQIIQKGRLTDSELNNIIKGKANLNELAQRAKEQVQDEHNERGETLYPEPLIQLSLTIYDKAKNGQDSESQLTPTKDIQ